MKANTEELTKLIEDAVDKGATSAEEIHRTLTDIPISVLQQLGASEETTKEMKNLQDTTIGGIYSLVHDINHQVANLAKDLIPSKEAEEEVED